MDFNELVKKQLLPIFQKEGFDITEEYKNIIRFESFKMKINIVFNDYEKMAFIEIGKKGNTLYPLSDKIVANVFNSELQIENVVPEIFIGNIAFIFKQSKGIDILNGDIGFLTEFSNVEILNYNIELAQKQTLGIATEKWKNKDYEGFINEIDKISVDKIPLSYLSKYNFSKKKIYQDGKDKKDKD